MFVIWVVTSCGLVGNTNVLEVCVTSNFRAVCTEASEDFSYTYTTRFKVASIHSFNHTNGTSESALHAKALRIPRACLNLSGVTTHQYEGELIRSKYVDVSSVTQST
jgi:hypothetical protein